MWRGDPHHCGHDSHSGKHLLIYYLFLGETEPPQDAFVIPGGAPGALAELERRKFTAEEGVSLIFCVTKLFSAHIRIRTILPY